LIDSLTQKYPIDTPITRQQYSHILFEFIAEIEDVSLMQHYLTLIANKLDTTVSVLFASYKQRFKTRTTLKRAESAPKVNKPFQPIPEIAIQSLLFQDFIHDQ
jgi:DnaB-helicase binding domain of primase